MEKESALLFIMDVNGRMGGRGEGALLVRASITRIPAIHPQRGDVQYKFQKRVGESEFNMTLGLGPRPVLTFKVEMHPPKIQ